jgi:hypothetical protein
MYTSNLIKISNEISANFSLQHEILSYRLNLLHISIQFHLPDPVILDHSRHLSMFLKQLHPYKYI